MFHGWILRGKPVKSCHLQADSETELVEFGKRIGLKPSWLQRKADSVDTHFDLTESKRTEAIAAGAIAQTALEFVNRRRVLRGIPAICGRPAQREEPRP